MPINYKEYPKNWITEIRPAVLKRAENHCEFCGVENHSIIYRFGKGINDWVPAGGGNGTTRVVLTIAHLDHDKSNHNIDPKRLKALCQKCHLGYDLKRHISNRKYGKKHNDNNTKLDFPQNP